MAKKPIKYEQDWNPIEDSQTQVFVHKDNKIFQAEVAFQRQHKGIHAVEVRPKTDIVPYDHIAVVNPTCPDDWESRACQSAKEKT